MYPFYIYSINEKWTVEFWEWISNLIPQSQFVADMITYPYQD